MTTTLYKKNFPGQLRSEPPVFWVALLLGSVVLHAVAFFSIRIGSVSSVNTVQTEPISVELIEIAPIVESPKPVSAGVSKITKATSPNSVLVSEPSKTVSPILANPKLLSGIKSSQGTAKAQSEKKESVSRVKISRTRAIAQVKTTHSPPSVSSRSTSKLKVSAKSVKPAPKPNVTVKSVAVRSPTAAPKPSIKPAPKPNVTVKPVAVRSPTPKPTAAVKPTEKRSQPVRAIPYPTPTKKRDREPLPPTPQPRENQHSSGIVATFDLGSSRSGDRDIPDQLAVPKQNQKQFPSVLDPLQLRLSQGSALILQILVEIDEQGKLTAIKKVNAVEDSSPPQSTAKTTDYLAIAQQLLKDWKFHPAYSGGQPVYSELWLRLTVKAQ